MTDRDRDTDRDQSPDDASHGDKRPPTERRELDLSADPLDFEMEDTGTADPSTIQDPEIREAVEEAQQKVAEQEQQRQQQPSSAPETDDDADAQTQTQTKTAGPMAELPNLADEPLDREEFFKDELGDPEREHKEAQVRGLDYTPNVNLEDPQTHGHDRTETEPDADTETTTMSDRNPDETREREPNTQSDDEIRREQQSRIQQGRDQPQEDADVEEGTEEHTVRDRPRGDRREADANQTRTPAAEEQRRGEPAEMPQSGQRQQQTSGNPQNRTPREADAGSDAAGGRPADRTADDGDVEQITEDDMREVGMEIGGDDDTGMPDPSDIDFESQDIEGASQDRGDQLIEFNDVYFLLTDIDDARAEQLLNDIQMAAQAEQTDEGGMAGDRFDTIINTVVEKPANAAERTRNWKYLHRATLAGRCMEHCGLDDIVDFQSASGDMPEAPPGR